MAEEQRGSRGKSYGNHKSYGSGRPGNRGGKGFKPRGNGGKSYGHKSGGFHNDDRKGGYRKGNGGGYRRGDRDFHRDGEGEGQERRFHNGPRKFNRDGERRDDRRGGYRGNRGDNPRYQRDGERSGFRHDDRRDGERRNFRHDGDRRDFRRDDGERRGGRNFHKDGDRRDFRRDDRRGERRDGERRNFRRDDRRDGGRRDFRRDNQRRDFHKDRDQRPEGEERREFTREEKMEYREAKRGEYLSKPRRNSDGTMSFPSQNPYTHRRPGEPKMPKGIEWSMLSTDDRERLRGLSKEHAENIGLHILAAYTLEERDPELALEHAKWVAHQASRIDFARETLAFVAYRQGDYKLALREFRTAFRMNGFLDYLPFIADCERGMGEPKKAIETAMSDDAKYLRGESKAEMFLVYAGALGDLELWDKAIEIVHTLGRSKGLAGEYRMRAVQAEQYFLEEAGRTDEAIALDRLLDKLELQYADVEDDETSDDLVVEYDMQELNDELMDVLGISEDDAQYAPEDSEDEEGESEAIDENGETSDETQLEAEEAEAGAESDDEPATQADAESSEADEADEIAEGESYSAEDEAEESSEASKNNK
uniref:tetratricopeptide repeat protein n=1 Tax=Bifidobacterium adolescentis TaxID=1680 RepID=UPI00359C85EF